MFNVKSMSKIVRRVSVYDLNMKRTHATVWKIIKTKTAYTRVTGCVLCEWRREKRLERDARVRARAFLSPSSPSSLFFSSSEYSIPLSFVAPLLLFLFLFSFSSCVCVHTRDSVCSIFLLVHYDYTRLHEALSSLFTSKFCYSTPHVYFRRRLSSPHRHSSTYCFSLCEPKFHVYIYIYFYTYVYYIYICICVYNCFCRFSHVSHRFLPWPTSLKKLFGYEKETKRENRPADEREKEM